MHRAWYALRVTGIPRVVGSFACAIVAVIAIWPRVAGADPEVCTLLDAGRTITWPDDDDELWPRCPVSTPITSMGGRCLDGSRCMRPCASTTKSNDFAGNYAYTYDTDGRFLSVTGTENGIVPVSVTCARDARGRLQTCTTRFQTFRYAYARGRLVSVAGEHETRTFTYDRKGRLKTERIRTKYLDYSTTYTYRADGTLRAYALKTGRDTRKIELDRVDGRLVAIRFPEGTVTYRYDDDGRVVAEEDLQSDGTKYEVAYRYDAMGRLVEQVQTGPVQREVTTYQYSCPERRGQGGDD